MKQEYRSRVMLETQQRQKYLRLNSRTVGTENDFPAPSAYGFLSSGSSSKSRAQSTIIDSDSQTVSTIRSSLTLSSPHQSELMSSSGKFRMEDDKIAQCSTQDGSHTAPINSRNNHWSTVKLWRNNCIGSVRPSRPLIRSANSFMFYSLLLTLLISIYMQTAPVAGHVSREEKLRLKEQVQEMFYHVYDSYMKNAYPADELMPLSCKGRYRDSEPNRGDIDDALGNFSLTLVDSIDTLVIMDNLTEFEARVKDLIRDVHFDSDIVVSVFETNIRMVGGLLSAHVLSTYLRDKLGMMSWYKGELLDKAADLGYRLLPAFNSSTGIPFPRVNLKYGLDSPKLKVVRETCTACAGTMILEFAALSRLTGDQVFETKARKAMDILWQQRNHASDLMGSILQIEPTANWVRRDSGVGAGIDSYYEYLLKAYILLGDEQYLDRFNKHYAGIMKYISQGPLLIDVHMHRPHTIAKHFMDALLAFWPGLQVLAGDIRPAIETHEILYQVMSYYNFLPEAFTTDFNVHWSQHPLRPEFVESTYFLYKATNDPHYLTVGKRVVNSLQKYARVPCGFAAVEDVRSGAKQDRLDSFFMAETLKYLYLLFAEDSDLPIDLNDYLFTTEAHLLPLSLGHFSSINRKKGEGKFNFTIGIRTPHRGQSKRKWTNYFTYNSQSSTSKESDSSEFLDKCPVPQFWLNPLHSLDDSSSSTSIVISSPPKKPLASPQFAQDVRDSLKDFVLKINENSAYSSRHRASDSGFCSWSGNSGSKAPAASSMYDIDSSSTKLFPRLRASEFQATNVKHLELIKMMGITVVVLKDGRVQLIHQVSSAANPQLAGEGALFMQEMIELSKQQLNQNEFHQFRSISYIDNSGERVTIYAGPAQFGPDLGKMDEPIEGNVILAQPIRACESSLKNRDQINGKIAIVERGDCMFVDKTRNIQKAGGIGVIVLDNVVDSSVHNSNMFAMSGDGRSDIDIPAVFVFHIDGQKLLKSLQENPYLIVAVGANPSSSDTETTGESEGSRSNAGQREDESHAFTSASDKGQSFKSPFAHGSIMDQLDKFYEEAIRQESFKKRWMKHKEDGGKHGKLPLSPIRPDEESKIDNAESKSLNDLDLGQGVAFIKDETQELLRELGLTGFEFPFNDEDEEEDRGVNSEETNVGRDSNSMSKDGKSSEKSKENSDANVNN